MKIWWLKKWFLVKQTCQQLMNVLRHQLLTPKGHEAYDYYCKVAFNQYEPISYIEMMFDIDIKTLMAKTNVSRVDAAIFCAGRLAKYIAPWDFWKKKHKIISR